jgi:magnesium chelatase family protein
MLSKLSTVSFSGIDSQEVAVEVQIAAGLPNFIIVGLPDKSIAESKERIRASFSHIGLSLPSQRIIVNLAPADLQKEGAHYDLPIALGIMAAMNIFDAKQLQEYVILGGLSLDAQVVSVAGVLPASIFAAASKRGLICPLNNRTEASWAGNLKVVAAPDLTALTNHFKGDLVLPPPLPPETLPNDCCESRFGDMNEIKGQFVLKRVFEIVAAGLHNVLLLGPPGAGKSMISQRLVSILPPLSPKEALEVTMIYSMAGQLPEEGIITRRPFRSPHHSASLVSLVGGGMRAKPGEISLAHNGVLFLDELPEFSRAALEALRQPLESQVITISRANQHMTYPAKIQLIAAMNPCRCGYFGFPQKECPRVPRCAADYQSRISGPLLDRFDLIFYVPQVPINDLFLKNESNPSESSAVIRDRVIKSVQFFDDLKKSSHYEPETLETLPEETQSCLKNFADKMELSARGCARLLRVTRTLANLSGCAHIQKEHVEEAIQYRYSLAV